MKTLSVLASMMVVLFLAVPTKVEAQKRKATKTTEAYGQKATNAPIAPDCRISNIKIVPFDSQTGEFQEEIKANDERSFFNDFTISLFVVVEISSQAYFDRLNISEKERKVEITVMEGNLQKAKKIKQISLHYLLGGGKIFVPLWLDPLMCKDVKINARIIGQRTVSTMKRTVSFSCGE